MAQADKDKLLIQLAKYAYRCSPEKIFPLASGGMSNEYLDCKKALSHPDTMAILGPLIRARLSAGVIAVGGLTMGADPIAMSASQSSAGTNHPVRWFSVRKEPKKHGLQKLIEGAVQPGDRVVVVDDVVTSGGSTVKAIEACHAEKLVVVQVIVLVDREQSNGIENIRAKAGCPVEAICTKSEIAAVWQTLNQTPALRATA